jgi:phage terminase large subunit-like protein
VELDHLSDAQLQELLNALLEYDDLKTNNPVEFFEPYEPQLQFFLAGLDKRERLFMAGNQTGKSTSGAFEAACHLTGIYPPWWQGKRFLKPVTGWACGQSGQQMRETIQLKLVGMRIADGVTGGLIPARLVAGHTLSHGAGDLFDTIRIKHVSGGYSTLSLKSYEQDATKWQGQTVDFIWIDEEPPIKHYNEALARLAGQGIVFITFTPLLGFSEVVSRFLREDDPKKMADRAVIRMGLKHVTHFTDQEKERRVAGYSDWEREARENGDPMLGEGAVFRTPWDQIAIDSALRVPLHWAKLWGTDFGLTHPFAAVLIAWDRDSDVVYVIDTVRVAEKTPADHARRLKQIAPDVRIAWPFDGNKRESSLSPLVTNYRKEGLHMLPTFAAWPDGSISTEKGIIDLDERMKEGRFRVLSHLADWQEEFRSYHRKDGKIVKLRDDLMSATRVAIMALRYARPGPIGREGAPGMVDSRHTPRMAKGLDFDPLATPGTHRHRRVNTPIVFLR